jgi:hypothetical protein
MAKSSMNDDRAPCLKLVLGGQMMLKVRTLWVVASTILGLSAVNDPRAYAEQKFSTIAIEKCGRMVLGSGKDAQTAEHNARYRCRIRGGLECGHLLAPVTVPSPSGAPCAAIATHRLGFCRFLAKADFGSSEEDAKKKAVELCASANAPHSCQVRPSHWICQ